MALRRAPIIIKYVLIGAGHKWTVYMLEIEEELWVQNHLGNPEELIKIISHFNEWIVFHVREINYIPNIAY